MRYSLPRRPAAMYRIRHIHPARRMRRCPVWRAPAPPGYGPPAGAGPAYAYPSAPPPAAGASGGGAIYTPANPAAPPPANGTSLFGDPAATMFPQAPGEPLSDLPLEIDPQETQTGRLMFGVGVNSDAGLVGNVTIDEQNFDWRNVPTSWEDIMEGRALRGAGERFRVELVPGTEVQRYMISYQDPYVGSGDQARQPRPERLLLPADLHRVDRKPRRRQRRVSATSSRTT